MPFEGLRNIMTPDITILFSLIVTAIVGWAIIFYRFSPSKEKGFEADSSDFQFFLRLVLSI